MNNHNLFYDIANRYANEIRAFPNEPSRYHVKASCLSLAEFVKKSKFLSSGWTELKLSIYISEVPQIVIASFEPMVAR